jgi:hypothetical protein
MALSTYLPMMAPWSRGVSPPGPGGDRPIVAESNKSAQELSWEPREVSARGPEEAILAKCTVGVVVQTHLKTAMKPSLTPK